VFFLDPRMAGTCSHRNVEVEEKGVVEEIAGL
jgi:hypothetical protein